MSEKYTFRRKLRGHSSSSPSVANVSTSQPVVKLERHDQIRVKQEKVSEEEEESNNHSSTPHYDNVRIKAEPRSDNDDDDKESRTNDSGDDELPEPKTKKFRRIKPIRDSDSDEDSEDERKILPSRVVRKNISSASEHDTTSASEEDESGSTSSGSSSPKGHIEFESSSDDVGTDKSYTSSETDEIDDDGSSKLCIVCRNLGNAKIKGRSKIKSTSPWCKCGHCKILGNMKDYDLICCREIKDVVDFLDDEMDDATKKNLCVTSHPRFQTDVIKCRALWRTGGYRRTDYYGNDDAYMGSWAFVRMIWNKLGWGTRMVVPACVSYLLKKENGTSYIKSFTAITTCETGKHCVQSQS